MQNLNKILLHLQHEDLHVWGTLVEIDPDIDPEKIFLPLWGELIPFFKNAKPNLFLTSPQSAPMVFDLEYPLGIYDLQISRNTKEDLNENELVDAYWTLMEKRALGEVDQNPYLWVKSHINGLVGLNQTDLFQNHARYVCAIETILRKTLPEFKNLMKQIGTELGPFFKIYQGTKKTEQGRLQGRPVTISLNDSGHFDLNFSLSSETITITREGLRILLWGRIYQILLES